MKRGIENEMIEEVERANIQRLKYNNKKKVVIFLFFVVSLVWDENENVIMWKL
jgi:hypothetical protein